MFLQALDSNSITSTDTNVDNADSNATNTAVADSNTINTSGCELATDSADDEECAPPSVSNDSHMELCVIPILFHRLPVSHPVVDKVPATVSSQVEPDGDFSGDVRT